MKIRQVYLANAKSLNDSDTVTIDITRGLKILRLRCQYQATNGATSNTVGRLNGMVSKLAILDGSSVLYSGSMREVQADNAKMYGRLPFQKLSQAAAAVITEEAVIDFTLGPGDDSHYLDTSRFANPQISLTHALTISATAGFATGTGKLSIIADAIDSGAGAALGFRMLKEIDSFASASSGDHLTDLPLDFPIIGIQVQDPVDAQLADHALSNFELTADTDSFIPINMTIDDLLRGNAEKFGRFRQLIDALNGTSATIIGDLYFDTAGDLSQAGATAKGIATVVTANEITLAMTTGETGVVTAKLHGQAPHSAKFYVFGDGQTPADFFSPQGVGKFQLKLTNAATGATVKVVVEQLHS